MALRLLVSLLILEPITIIASESLGDTVALIQIIVDLVGILRIGQASSECKDLIEELEVLEATLQNNKEAIAQDAHGSATVDRSPWNAIETAVKECYSLIKDFSQRTQGYGKSLFMGERGSNLWDFGGRWIGRYLRRGRLLS